MVKHLKIIFLFAFLYNNQVGLAQTQTLGEITAIADSLIGEDKAEQALFFLEQIVISDFPYESDLELASFYYVKACSYELNEMLPKSIESYKEACCYYEKAGVTYYYDIFYSDYLSCLLEIGNIYQKLGNYDLSKRYYRKIILSITPAQFLLNNDDFKEKFYLNSALLNLSLVYVYYDEYEMADICLLKIKQIDDSFQNKEINELLDYITKKLHDKTDNP